MATSTRRGFGHIITKLAFISLLVAGFKLSAVTNVVVEAGQTFTFEPPNRVYNSETYELVVNAGATIQLPPSGNFHAFVYMKGEGTVTFKKPDYTPYNGGDQVSFKNGIAAESTVNVVIEDVIYNLKKQIVIALPFREEYAETPYEELSAKAEELTIEFLARIPRIRALVNTDMQASFEGDPAAFNKAEIVLCYPGLLASTINRLAHELFLLGVPLIPRMMTEHAHSKTGIDIHPGATIGEYFFMDHGTGIVVGETSIIGKHVKIYQGVTIGALSTRGGQRLRGAKRHPTIEDNVTIYAGASILGGETTIGEGSVIGSNVFITSSVKPGSRISVKTQELIIHNKTDDLEHGGSFEETKPDDTWLEE